MAGKLLLQGVNFIREAIASLCWVWLRLQKVGMVWDVRRVNTALPEGRGCVAFSTCHMCGPGGVVHGPGGAHMHTGVG